MNSFEKIPIVIVSYQTSHLMRGLIDSIQEENVDISIIILDNGSTVESFKILSELEDSRLVVLRSSINLGFAGGVNFVVKYILKHLPEVSYFFLLNPDALSSINLISGLKKILYANKNAACISPKIYAKDGRTWYGGSILNFKNGSVSSSIRINHKNKKDTFNVDVFNGCAVLFHIGRFVEAGMLNEKLFMYYEEADCALKLRKLGYDILYTPSFSVLHDVSYTTRKTSYVKTYYMTRNKFILFNGSMSLHWKVWYIAHEFAHHIKHKRYKNAIYLLKGYIDFRKGKTGRIGSTT